MFCCCSDEEAGQAGVEHHNDEDEADGEVKVETNQRQSLTHRLSSLYETLMSKAAPKKSASGEKQAPGQSATTPSGTTPAPAQETESSAKVIR